MSQPSPPTYNDPYGAPMPYGPPAQPNQYGAPMQYGHPVQQQPVMSNQTSNVTNVIVTAAPAGLVPMKRDWTTPMCGLCMDCGVCCAAWFFPWCYTCHVATTMDEHCCIGMCTPGALIAMRAKVRAKENIIGGICKDTCLYCFCHVCILAQLGREVKAIKARGGSF